MTFLQREEFETSVMEGVRGFVNRYCKNKSDFNNKKEVEAKIDLFFGRNPKISKVASEIGLATKTQTVNTELLIRTTMEFAYDNYKVDIEEKQKEISFLRRKLRVAQLKSRSGVATATKKESETRAKERIISKKNLKLEKLNKENRSLKKQISLLKKENSKMLDKEKINVDQQVIHSEKRTSNKKKKMDKKFSRKISCAGSQEMINGAIYKLETMELYIYDILKKYQGSEILMILKNFGEVSSYAVKRLHKYQLIKAEIFLN
jgi:hypothetical protein